MAGITRVAGINRVSGTVLSDGDVCHAKVEIGRVKTRRTDTLAITKLMLVPKYK